MKIIVDQLPKSSNECAFAIKNKKRANACIICNYMPCPLDHPKVEAATCKLIADNTIACKRPSVPPHSHPL